MEIKKLNSENLIKKSEYLFQEYMLEIILLTIIIILSVIKPGFLTVGNILNVLRNVSIWGVIAFGMTITIICGEIDLSVGSMVALSGIIVAKVSLILSNYGISIEYGAIIGIIVALTVSVISGLLNGYLLIKIKMPSFIITLAMALILFGVAALISDGFPLVALPGWYNFIGTGMVFNIISIPVLILIIVFVITFILMNYTIIGRSVYAVGGNIEASRLSGINVNKVKILSMTIVQVCAAISGIIFSSLVMSANHTFGKGFEFTVISAVIIGGVSLFGGIGKIWGTLVGIIFIGVVINGMTLFGFDEYLQYVVRGGLILLAVAINTYQKSRNI